MKPIETRSKPQQPKTAEPNKLQHSKISVNPIKSKKSQENPIELCKKKGIPTKPDEIH